MGKVKYFDIEGLKEYGITQSMLAEEMGVDRQEVNAWLTGTRRISPVSMKKVCNALTKLTGKKFFPSEVYGIVNQEIKRRTINDNNL